MKYQSKIRVLPDLKGSPINAGVEALGDRESVTNISGVMASHLPLQSAVIAKPGPMALKHAAGRKAEKKCTKRRLFWPSSGDHHMGTGLKNVSN